MFTRSLRFVGQLVLDPSGLHAKALFPYCEHACRNLSRVTFPLQVFSHLFLQHQVGYLRIAHALILADEIRSSRGFLLPVFSFSGPFKIFPTKPIYGICAEFVPHGHLGSHPIFRQNIHLGFNSALVRPTTPYRCS